MKAITPLPSFSSKMSLPVTPTISTLPDPRILQQNRTNMTILHFLITYPKWSVSLFLFLASTSLPLPSVDDAIHQPIRQLRSLLRAEANAYQQCVRRSFQRCSIAIDEAVQVEDGRVAQVRRSNEQRLQQLNNLNGACLQVTQTARNALQAWSQANTRGVPTVNDTRVCTSGDQGHLTILLQNGVVAVENDLSGMDNYVSNSESFSHRLVQYTHELAKYNYQYFVADKVQPVVKLLDQITAPSFNPKAIQLNLDGLNLDAHVGLSLQGVQDVLQRAANEMGIMMERLQEFDQSIASFHLQYLNLYANFVKVITFVQDLSLGLPLPGYFDVGSIPLADSLLPFHIGIPQFQGGLLSLPGIPQLISNTTRQVVEELDKVISKMARGATTQVGLAEQDLAHQLRDMLTLQNYHPPVFSGLEEEISKLHQESQQAINNVKHGLNQLWTTSSNNVMDILPPASELDPNNVTYFEANASSFDYLEPEFPSLSIPLFLKTIFGWLLHYMWLTELILQGLRLWRLDSKYSRNATPDLPEIDYLTNHDGDEVCNNNNRDQDSYLQRKLRSIQILGFTMLKYMCCNFWMIVALFAIPLGLGLSCLMYPHYRVNCVESRNGTFIARHLWAPVVVNEANLGGNTMFLLGEAQLVHDKSTICNRNFTETTRDHRLELSQLSQIQQQYNQTLLLVSLMDNCVDLVAVDNSLEQACCGLKGYSHANGCGPRDGVHSNWSCPIDHSSNPPAAFLPLRQYLSHPTCPLPQGNSNGATTSAEWRLDDSRFNCEAMPKICQVPCRSVDEEWILHQVIQAECAIEGYYFGCIFLFLVALYHAIMLNLWTMFVFNGVKCLWWRQLNPNGLVFKTRIYEDGTLVREAHLREDRSERIRTVLQRFQLFGYLQLSIGIIFFMAWMISFAFLSNLVAE